jgi:hypothetical protein
VEEASSTAKIAPSAAESSGTSNVTMCAPALASRSIAGSVAASTSASSPSKKCVRQTPNTIPRTPAPSAALQSSWPRPPAPGSARSGPVMDAVSSAASATDAASGPAWSSDQLCGTMPPRPMRPKVGFRPTQPQRLAGMRIDLPVSEPKAAAANPAATATPEPPLEPPGTRSDRAGCGRRRFHAPGELVHPRLADQYGTRRAQPRHARSVLLGPAKGHRPSPPASACRPWRSCP